ncbi:MAG: HPr family phosphocarrier protein [Bacilli bacterium]
MVNTKVKIIDPVGLHARPAALIVEVASQFESDIVMLYNDKTANLKSILNVLALAVKTDSEVEIQIDGSDEQAALDKIVQVMQDNKLI